MAFLNRNAFLKNVNKANQQAKTKTKVKTEIAPTPKGVKKVALINLMFS